MVVDLKAEMNEHMKSRYFKDGKALRSFEV